jgi:hypothetical protein
MAPYLAERGFDVYGYTPRPSLLAEGECAARDCSPMAGWGVDTYVRDLDLIRIVATAMHFKKPAIGGMSLGAMLTLSAVNHSPYGYAGAIVWEGTMHFSDPSVSAAFQPLYESYVQTLSAGLAYDDQTPAFFKTVWMLMQADPDGASPFADGVTNRQYALLVNTTPAEPPVGEAPGYTYLTGDLVNGFYYTDEAPLGEFIPSWAYYDSIALLRDLALSRAGSPAFVDHLQRFRGPVLAIEAGHGFGASAEDSLALFTHATSIERLVFPDRSHVDVLFARDQETTVTEPTYNWLLSSVVPRM